MYIVYLYMSFAAVSSFNRAEAALIDMAQETEFLLLSPSHVNTILHYPLIGEDHCLLPFRQDMLYSTRNEYRRKRSATLLFLIDIAE